MTLLRLGAHHLPAGECGLIRAQIKLLASSDDAQFPWMFVDAAPYDAVVVDAHSPDASSTSLPFGVRAILSLATPGHGNDPTPDLLFRPLRTEQLEAWLHRTQARLSRAEATAGVATGQDRKSRFKLRRWPPSELLRDDTQRVRMATFLSRRGMTVNELAAMSQQPEGKCQTFVQMLQSFGLLDVQPVEAIVAPRAAAVARTDAAPRELAALRRLPPPPPVGWTLVRSIRQRLGI